MESQNQGSNHNDGTVSGVSGQAIPSDSSANPPPKPDSESNDDPTIDALAKALSSMLTSLIKDFDSKARHTVASQDLLSSSIDRLTRELDQLLEDAPLPFIMQHAVKISNLRRRVSSLNLLLKSIQRRIDDIDRMLSMGLQHGNGDHAIMKSSPRILYSHFVFLLEGLDFQRFLHSLRRAFSFLQCQSILLFLAASEKAGIWNAHLASKWWMELHDSYVRLPVLIHLTFN
ncbi:hypothetical protein V6N13_145142 [Hibiscus sabdariffa]|uniref:Biogenesis of lysosome-related organelles complex 1 subunit 7 n=1 Tax=Hibiscus sabdariffa TaxID=183260 RepID=A0ABR2FMH2_9ROSI